jgi:hypothetical protein
MSDSATNENVFDKSVKDPAGDKDRYDDPQFKREFEEVAEGGGTGPSTKIGSTDETVGHGNAEGTVNVLDDSVAKEE